MNFSKYQIREKLGEQLPLNTPFSIHVCPTTFCNFKCKYCVHSLSTADSLPNGLKKRFMNLDIFSKLIEQVEMFDNKLKLINFAYLGEPLLNKNIPQMVDMAKKSEVAERVEIVSNASMLTHEISEKLVEAKLDRLRISIQGLNSQEYFEMSSVKIDYRKLIDEIAYLFNISRGTNTKIYIKTVDSVVNNYDRKKIFFENFSGICDNINIENLIPISSECDISDLKNDFDYGFFGNRVRCTKICSEIFYTMVITPEGYVFPCCTMGKPLDVIGNIVDENIVYIWNSEKLKQLRISMLKNGYKTFPSCKDCGVPLYQTSKEDYLDEYSEVLLEKITKDDRNE